MQLAKEAQDKTHIAELDGVRGLAAVAVVFHHIAQKIILEQAGLMHAVTDVFMFGFLGVDVFFALSGFLITRILLNKRDSGDYYRNFYARRLLRLLPPYLLAILLIGIFVPGAGPLLALSILYVANFWFPLHVHIVYGVLWSLSIEEQFYLVWPALIRRIPLRRIALICLFVCLLTPLARLQAVASLQENYSFLSWYRFDGLCWGALLAVLVSEHRWHAGAPGRRAVMAAGNILFLTAIGLYASGRKEAALAIFYTAVPMLTITLIGKTLEKPHAWLAPLRSRTLRFFGDISYWLYLIHLLFVNAADAFLRARYPQLVQHGGFLLWAAMLTLVLAPSVLSGIVVRHLIELPFLRQKRRFADASAVPLEISKPHLDTCPVQLTLEVLNRDVTAVKDAGR